LQKKLDLRVYAHAFASLVEAPPDRPYVIGQIGQSLDGRVATRSGDARDVSGPAGLDHLHRLRSYVDAVVVGAGTIAADNPRLTVRRVLGDNPARVVIDPSGRLGQESAWLANDGAARILVTAEGDNALCDHIIRLPRVDGRLQPAQIVSALYGLGLRRILVEGGPATLAAFLQHGCLDRLQVVVSPIIIGSGKAALDLEPVDFLAEALRPRAEVHVLDDGEALFDCDLRAQAQPGGRAQTM